MSLSRSLTLAIRRPSTSLLHLPPWLARSYASASTLPQPSPPEEDRHVSVEHYTQHKQRALARSEAFTQTSLNQELRYLGDPRKLADYIHSLLRKEQKQKAYELVKISSRNLPCTVSWNHLIDFEMSKGRVGEACKLYNDMKKRAQQPDARTYTFLLRGLAAFPHYPQSLTRALSIYESMYADKCPVKPSIIHINAVLNVCAQCNDVDALLGIAAKLPTRGAGAPDKYTFTTILNAIRTEAWQLIQDDTPEGKAARRHRASMQGREIWGEIIRRWKKMDIRIDERLVCEMGRLLLIADSERTCREILSLVAQTMGIQQPQSLGYRIPSDSEGLDAPEHASTSSDDQMVRSPSLNEPGSDSDELPDDIPGSEFYPLSESDSKRVHFAKAGCNTLSMVLDACIRLRAIPAGQDYWGLLTDPNGPHNITPDSENYHMFLRLLRVQRASRLALELVRDMRRGPFGAAPIELEPKTFRLALSACVRDIKNPNVLENAGALARMMLDTLPLPDITTLEMYLHVAMYRESNDWMAMMSVLRGSVLGVRNIRSQLMYNRKGTIPQFTSREGLVRLIRKLIGAFDVVMTKSNGLMSKQDHSACMEQRNTLTSWMTRANRQMQVAIETNKVGDSDGVDTASNTGVETRGQNPLNQETWQIAQPKRPADEPREANAQKLSHSPQTRMRWKSTPRTEGGARDRMRRMAQLDEQYTGRRR